MCRLSVRDETLGPKKKIRRRKSERRGKVSDSSGDQGVGKENGHGLG